MTAHATGLTLTTEEQHDRYEVRLNGHLIGYHQMLIKGPGQAIDKVLSELADMLGQRLGWPQDPDTDL